MISKTTSPTAGAGGEPEAATDAPRAVEATGHTGYAAFLSRIAHDLRSPIGVVLHVLSQLGSEFDPDLNDERRTWLKLGTRSARRMQNLVDRLSLLAELESQKIVVASQRVDFRDVIGAAVDATLGTEPRSEIRLIWEPPQAACLVLADPRLLTRAVQEVVRNAVAHARSVVRVTITREHGMTTAWIEDDGNGVAANALDSSSQRFAPGAGGKEAGVGLSIVQDLVRLQKGKVGVSESTLSSSRPGKVGARFSVSIPDDSRSG